MKKSIQLLVLVATLGSFSLAAQSQPAVKLYVCDMAKLYDSRYKTIEKKYFTFDVYGG